MGAALGNGVTRPQRHGKTSLVNSCAAEFCYNLGGPAVSDGLRGSKRGFVSEIAGASLERALASGELRPADTNGKPSIMAAGRRPSRASTK